MFSTEHLQKLLNDFISGKISPEDAEELFEIINNQDIDDKIIAWLYMRWDESSMRSVGFHSEGIRAKIRKHLNLPVKVQKEEREYLNYMLNKEIRTNRKVVLNMLKYAAVFIIAVASSFILIKNTQFLVKNTGLSEEVIEETYTEVRIQNGSKSTIILPDSSIIKINSGSYVRYPDHFKGTNRWVFLEGEAFFDINPELPVPFYVKTSNISIKVTGTKFNVKSFPDEQYIETTLISGSIIIEDIQGGQLSEQQIVLNPNQLAVFNKSTKKLDVSELTREEEIIMPKQPVRITTEPEIIKNADILTSWKDDKMVFYNEYFGDLALRLERWYDVNIKIADAELKDYRFTGAFMNENIEQVLEALKLASSFEYQINKNQIIISKQQPDHNTNH